MEGKQKSEVYIRSDGWVFTQDGMDRLRAGGYKGFTRFKESMEAKLGAWHRVSKPLDKDAAAALKSVKGLVERGVFLSSAIVKEAERRMRGTVPDVRSINGKSSPCEFMRLTLTDDAYYTIRHFANREFREFVSSAILRAANKRK